jgi:hypothetical protein
MWGRDFHGSLRGCIRRQQLLQRRLVHLQWGFIQWSLVRRFVRGRIVGDGLLRRRVWAGVHLL